MTKILQWTIFSICLLVPVLRADEVFVVTTEQATNVKENENSTLESPKALSEPKIYEMQIDSNITNRYARTLITSKVRNLNNIAAEATFSVILPDKAFISEFVMVVGGKSYKAYVKEKEEAKNIYDQAVASGIGAAHVAVSARESNRFTVSVNVEALSKATFLLTYEELLRLKDDLYELIINIHPKQPVKDLFVNVAINESRPLKFVKAPALRSGNEITKGEGNLDSRADIQHINSTSAIVKFNPDIERQKELAKNLGTDINEGLSGQFVVQYDVERDPHGGEVLIQGGYFVHFFAPTDLKPLNKYIIFVLDNSGSMWGQKMPQLKEAMNAILDQLDTRDYFHIVGFESTTKVWDIDNPENSTETKERYDRYREGEIDPVLTDLNFPAASSGIDDNIKKAKEVVGKLGPLGGTNIHEALQVALILIEREKNRGAHKNLPQPMIMFLTDGDPTVGITARDVIVSDITKFNKEKVPIFSLSFGEDADKNFLKKLSQKNQAFSRHIYEASDAALQLRNFYKEISSPLLKDVKFEYVPETTSLTKTTFPIHFGGSEIIVAGKISTDTFSDIPQISCEGIVGPVIFRPAIERPVTSLERLWAYLTVQQLLDERDTAPNKTVNEKKALDLALKYSFVTPVSSLVVVKPNSTDSDVNPEAADKVSNNNLAFYGAPLSLSGGGSASISAFPHSNRGGYFDVQPASGFAAKVPAFRPFLLTTPFIPVQEELASLPPILEENNTNNSLQKLKSVLPWLDNILNANETFKTPLLDGYKLGINEITPVTNQTDCPLSPTNTTGHCTLLHACPQIHHLLTTADLFEKYFCPLLEFAGICCPSSSVNNSP